MNGPARGDVGPTDAGIGEPAVPRDGSVPREITPGVEWIHECFPLSGGRHEHVSVYLVRAPGGNVVIDSGSFLHREAINARLERAVGDDGLSSVVLSHTDYPHSGNVPAFLKRWDDVEIVASCSDAEIQGLPYARRSRIDEPLDVCGRPFLFLDPPLADRSHTTWIYDVETRVVFAADGFGNYHVPGECDRMSSELEAGIRAPDLRDFHEDTLVWLRYADPPVLMRAIQRMIEDRPIEWICPIHGNPIHSGDLPGYVEMLGTAVEEICRGG